jgi:hypothetical protein
MRRSGVRRPDPHAKLCLVHNHDHEQRSGRRSVESSNSDRLQQSELAIRPQRPLDGDHILQVQRSVGNGAATELVGGLTQRDLVDRVRSSGGGQPLQAETRKEMEGAFGADFAGVRVHTNSHADESARALGASAYTTGDDVVFERGRFQPDTPEGKKTLAHELTHVVQQREGPVDGKAGPSGVAVSDPGDRFEKDASAAENLVDVQQRSAAPSSA